MRGKILTKLWPGHTFLAPCRSRPPFQRPPEGSKTMPLPHFSFDFYPPKTPRPDPPKTASRRASIHVLKDLISTLQKMYSSNPPIPPQRGSPKALCFCLFLELRWSCVGVALVLRWSCVPSSRALPSPGASPTHFHTFTHAPPPPRPSPGPSPDPGPKGCVGVALVLRWCLREPPFFFGGVSGGLGGVGGEGY